MKVDRLHEEKRPAIGKGQTRVGDRLQPSLTAPSMFNAVGQRRGWARAAPLVEEVSSGAFRLGETAGTLEECDRGLPHKWSIGRVICVHTALLKPPHNRSTMATKKGFSLWIVFEKKPVLITCQTESFIWKMINAYACFRSYRNTELTLSCVVNEYT